MTTQYPGTLRYFNGYLTITNPSTEYQRSSQASKKSQFRSQWSNQNRKRRLRCHNIQSPFNKQVCSKKPLSRKFQFQILSTNSQQNYYLVHFRKCLKNSFNLASTMLNWPLPLGTRNLQLHLSGTPVIGGYKTVHMSAVITRQGEKTKLLAGFQFRQSN